MEPQTIAFENVSLSDTEISKLSYLSISNEIFETIMVEVEVEEPRNVNVRCKRFGNGFELHGHMPSSTVSQIFRRSRQWAKLQHAVAHLAYRKGYSCPLEPLQNFYFNPEIDTLCPVMEEDWSPEAFCTLCEVLRFIKVSRIAISDCMNAEDARRSHWGTFYTMSNIENWSSSFKDIMMYTTKQSFDENYRPKFVTFEGSRTTINMYQSKAWSIQMHHARPMLKKSIAMKDAQDVAEKEAERNVEGRTVVEEIPSWLFEKNR